MKAEGFTQVDSDPDLYVTFYGKVSEQIVLNTATIGYSWGSAWHRGRTGFGHTTTTVSTYARGTLVIDMWEAAEKNLVWRGLVSDVIGNNPDRNTHRLNQGISRAFGRFPPASSS